MAGNYFIVPSRKAGLPPVILSAPGELAAVLLMQKDISKINLSMDIKDRLQKLAYMGMLEEYNL